jgi:hypothetical protein
VPTRQGNQFSAGLKGKISLSDLIFQYNETELIQIFRTFLS